MAVHSRPEPSSVWRPRPATAKVKMVGYITEFIRPTASRLHMAMEPVVLIEISTSTTAPTEMKASSLAGENLLSKYAPAKRPTMAAPQ
jgi:hypothetical protein